MPLTMDDYTSQPFDIRTVPNWTIPQLGWFIRRKDFTVLEVRRMLTLDSVIVYVHIEDEGVYWCVARKEDMNNPRALPLYFH